MAQLPAAIVLTQAFAASSQLSAVQDSASAQLRGAPAHAAAALQASPVVQKRPSSQAAPTFGLHALRLRAGSQISQPFAALTAPDAWQAPPMRQPTLGVPTHRSLASSQVSLVHDRPSEHGCAAPAQIAAATSQPTAARRRETR